jgi:hypothetical protein
MFLTRKPYITAGTTVLIAALAAAQSLGSNGVRIKNPSPGTNLVGGNVQSFSGSMFAARHGQAGNWTVDYPTVRLEFWWGGSLPAPYLLTSTQTAMQFLSPVPPTGPGRAP